MNTVDLIVVVVFLSVFTAAFFAGVVRSVVGLLSLIVATVIAAFFYKSVGQVVSHVFIPIDKNIAYFGAFILLLLAAGVGVDYLRLRSFKISRLQSHMTLEFRGGVVGVIGLILLSVVLSAAMLT
ncbi:MAG: CvpA family protein, partial [Nitrolancea sp.]